MKKPKQTQRIAIGKWGEAQALKFMEEHGYALLQRNYRSPDGEIDLVMVKGRELVFVEVKTRSSNNFGPPEEAVDDEKLDHLDAAAEWYIDAHKEFSENWRLDVIAVIGRPGNGTPEIVWYENVSGE